MERSLTLFLSCSLIASMGYGQASAPKKPFDCSNMHLRDSLITKYIDNGAEKLQGYYNDPAWQLYCDSALAICPDLASVYQLKAVPYLKNGEYAKAFALDEKAAELDPKTFTSYLGFLKCIFTKDYEGALVDFKKAEELAPNGYEMDHTYPFYMGLCNLETGRYTRAKENFKKDIFIQTGGDTTKSIHFNTLFYVGILNYKMGNYKDAKAYLLKCLKVYEMFPEPNYWLAQIYRKEKNRSMETKYLTIARQAIKQGYSMNEGNIFYVNYPYQITIFEIEAGLKE